MQEYGVFNDEGCVGAQCYSEATAWELLLELADPDEDEHGMWVAKVCPDHEEQEKDSCDECFADEDDADQEES